MSDGSQIPKEALDDLIECSVECSLHLPDVCTIRFDDHEFKWLDSDHFKEGKEIHIEGSVEGESLLPLFTGEVTSIEMDLAAMGMPSISVRCMSHMHRFHRGRFQRSFVQSTHSDIVQKIAGELGFSVDSDSTSPVFDWIFQNNQTNFEFLNMLAGRNGFRVYSTPGKKLHFKKVTDAVDQEVKLEWGKEIRSFRPRVASSSQVDQVVVQGWDPKAKQAITETVSSASGVPQAGGGAVQGGDIAKKAFGQAKLVVVDRPVQSAQEASSLAQSIIDEIGGSFLEADGLCHAKPDLQPGMHVSIENIGNRFSGKYYVTSTIQTYTPSEGFVTQFSVSGKKPSNMTSATGGRDLASKTQLGGNVVVGIVTNLQDPDDLGRVKVRYPWLSQDHESFWVRLVTPMAGPGRGIEFIPEVDDEVLVAFEHGDIHRPFILGAVWNGVDKPVEPNSKAVVGGKVQRRTIKTRIGHFQLFDDTDGKGEMSWTTNAQNRLCLDDKNQNITLLTTNGHTVVLDDQNQNITIKSKQGHTVLLDDQGSKILVQDMTGNNTVTINSNDNSMALACMGDFSVNAQGQVSITGQQGITLSTPMQFQASGDMGSTLQSSANVTIQGMMVNIN